MAASITDVQALEDPLAGLDDLQRASIDRAIANEVEARAAEIASTGIDPEEYDRLERERDDLQAENDTLGDRVAELEREVDGLQRELVDLRGKAA